MGTYADEHVLISPKLRNLLADKASQILSKELLDDFPEASKHNLFDKALGFSPIPEARFEIHYGDGSFAKGSVGNVGNADLVVGGLTVEGQAVEVANNVDESFITGEGDGLLGLAWGSLNSVFPRQVQTPVENMITQKDIPKNQELFTCKLGSWRDANEPDHGDSFYTFGFIDQPTLDAAEGPIWYTPLVHGLDQFDGFWRFESTSIVVNGHNFDRPKNTAIADTGTTLALIDDQALNKIYKQIPGAKIGTKAQGGGWIYPAHTTLAQLPTISIDAGGKQFVIQKEDIGFASAGQGWIYGSFQSRGSGQNFDILGDAFLKSIYAIFDQGYDQGDGKPAKDGRPAIPSHMGRFGAVQRKELHQNISVPQ
jgi:hypothetical protein